MQGLPPHTDELGRKEKQMHKYYIKISGGAGVRELEFETSFATKAIAIAAIEQMLPYYYPVFNRAFLYAGDTTLIAECTTKVTASTEVSSTPL